MSIRRNFHSRVALGYAANISGDSGRRLDLHSGLGAVEAVLRGCRKHMLGSYSGSRPLRSGYAAHSRGSPAPRRNRRPAAAADWGLGAVQQFIDPFFVLGQPIPPQRIARTTQFFFFVQADNKMDAVKHYLEELPPSALYLLSGIGALVVATKLISYLKLVLSAFVLPGVNVSHLEVSLRRIANRKRSCCINRCETVAQVWKAWYLGCGHWCL